VSPLFKRWHLAVVMNRDDKDDRDALKVALEHFKITQERLAWLHERGLIDSRFKEPAIAVAS